MNELEPLDWQESHSPTEAVIVTISASGRRVKEQCRRRKADARIWNDMTPDQEKAANRILEGYTLNGGQIGFKTMAFALAKFGKSYDGDCVEAEILKRQMTIALAYREWCKESTLNNINLFDLLGYLSGLDTLSDLDKKNGVRPGGARRNLFSGLDIYVKTNFMKKVA